MKQNLLKYGLVMVLAMIASMGLLWAEEKESVGVKSRCCKKKKSAMIRSKLRNKKKGQVCGCYRYQQ